jgi:cell division protein FtsA
MQETTKYAAGLDVGTTRVRCVVGYNDDATGKVNIVGVGEADNTGMRKGVVVNLVAVAQAIDKALEDAERMSGQQITKATVSINGSHIKGISSQGVVAVGSGGREVNDGDISRAEEAAAVLKMPANREILEITPRDYRLDGQENIKDPLGMTGVRLEVNAYVITALAPHLKNLVKTIEMTETIPAKVVLAGLGAARSVLSDQQMENGVVLIDIGGTTTNLVVFEEGDLQHVSVIPMGGNNITNDLAIGLKTDLNIAEEVKLRHGRASAGSRDESQIQASVEVSDKNYEFDVADIDMIVGARLDELFEMIASELKSIGKFAKLPGGVVITGGGANLEGIDNYAKESLQLSSRVSSSGSIAGDLGGMVDSVSNPEYSTAVGLMLIDMVGSGRVNSKNNTVVGGEVLKNMGSASGKAGNKILDFLKKFKS